MSIQVKDDNSVDSSRKISIRFFNDHEVRAFWDEQNSKWWFSATDIIGAVNNEADYTKAGNYWRWLKRKLKLQGVQFVSSTHKLKITAADGKKYSSDVLDSREVITVAKSIPNEKAAAFLDWFLYSDNTVDGQSKKKAYQLFESGILQTLKPGTVKSLQQIHAYLFGGLYDFAGSLRTRNISKSGFHFASAEFLGATLEQIERMPEETFEQIADKYVEMNVAHPFMEGNGRATRIWLDLMLKHSLNRCIDWSRINKNDYLNAMSESVADAAFIKKLLFEALTDKIDDREMFMKGIDYSYYYEEEDSSR